MSSRSKPKSKPQTSSPSRKSGSGSKPRLKRTLSRRPTFHAIVEDDLKYLWAAYKLGSFGPAEDISKDEFNNRVADMVALTDLTYTLVSQTKNGKIPVGMFSGNFNGPMFFVGDARWFKWATDRNKLESALNALNELRRDYTVVLHNHMNDKKFYETIAKYGVIRQVGRLFDIYEDSPAQIWQTRRR